jgi:hypothetical protein
VESRLLVSMATAALVLMLIQMVLMLIQEGVAEE